MDAQESTKMHFSGVWVGTGRALTCVGGTSELGSHEPCGSGSLKGDGEWYGQFGRVGRWVSSESVEKWGHHPQDTVSPSEAAAAADCIGQSTQLNSEGPGCQAQCCLSTAVCLRASVLTLRASLSSSVEWA